MFELNFRKPEKMPLPALDSEVRTETNGDGSIQNIPFIMPLSAKELELAPLTIEVSDNISVKVTGIVDRVDMFHGEDGKDYLRIVDYKTGGHSFRVSNALYGINTQMLIYLIAMCESNPEVSPGGVSYISANMSEPSQGFGTLLALLAADHRPSEMYVKNECTQKEQQLFAEGYIKDIFGAIPQTKDSKSLSPADMLTRDDSTPDEQQFHMLRERLLEQIRFILRKLYSGDIPAIPTIYKDGRTDKEGRISSSARKLCDYCRFKAICGNQQPDGIYVDEAIAEKLIGLAKKKKKADNSDKAKTRKTAKSKEQAGE